MKKAYMVCDYADPKAASISGTPHVGIEYLGDCGGRILEEDGTEIGRHHSSSYGWLRSDLRSKLDNPDEWEVVDLIGQPTPDRFKIPDHDYSWQEPQAEQQLPIYPTAPVRPELPEWVAVIADNGDTVYAREHKRLAPCDVVQLHQAGWRVMLHYPEVGELHLEVIK